MIFLPSTSVTKELLLCLLTLRSRLGAQPQRHVRRLHRLPYHPYQVVIEGFQVRLVPELRRECLKGLSSVVLPAVEPAVHEPLHPATQRYKQGSDGEGRGHDCEGGLLTSEQDEEPLRHDDTAEVERHQCGGQRAVDEGAVDNHVYMEQVRA